jgi:hypothetical protein
MLQKNIVKIDLNPECVVEEGEEKGEEKEKEKRGEREKMHIIK